MNDTEKNDKISVSLKKSTIELLDEIARSKVNEAISKGSFDVINLIRSKRGRGVSYDTEINFLARIYLALMDEMPKSNNAESAEYQKLIARIESVNNFFKKEEKSE